MRSRHLKVVPPATPVRAAIYARVSSDQQAERQTIGSQLSELKALASREGHEVKGRTPSGRPTDVGVSPVAGVLTTS